MRLISLKIGVYDTERSSLWLIELMKLGENDKVRMKELRQSGLGLREISKITKFSVSTVWSVVKDTVMPIGFYEKELLVSLLKGTIIDVETTGLNPDVNEIVTFGYLTENKVSIMQRVEASATEFYKAIKSKLSKLPHPFYAYNAKFDQMFLNSKLKRKTPPEFIDIFKPWMERAELEGQKYPSLDELARLPRAYFKEKIIKGRDVPFLWAGYQKTKDKRKLSPIVRHCMEDLVQALFVLVHKEL